MPRWLPRLLGVLGWFLLVVGAVALFGHVLRPHTARTPELGRYGGWINDAMALGWGVGLLVLRRKLRRRPEGP
jgi:hypothetical protein